MTQRFQACQTALRFGARLWRDCGQPPFSPSLANLPRFARRKGWLSTISTISTIYTGAEITKEAQQYFLYFFYGDIALKDLVGDGKLEIVVDVPIIYKAGIFFGSNPMSSVGWYDVFVLDGMLKKADSRFPEFYRRTLAEYKKFQENIRNFDFKGYAARNKRKYANPDLYEKGIVDSQSEYLKILSTAILATEAILKEK